MNTLRMALSSRFGRWSGLLAGSMRHDWRMRLPLFLLVVLASACGPSLAVRYEAGNRALSAGDGAMYFVRISAALREMLNECIPAGTPGAAPMLVLVADVDAAGNARNLDLEPDSPGTECLAQRIAQKPLPRPPLADGATSFPIGLRIETK
jgi:hypothetical protein